MVPKRLTSGVRGHELMDAQCHKIGEMRAVYVETSTDPPSFGRVGIPSTGSCSCRLTGRQRAHGYLKVAYDKNQVKDTPSTGTEGELSSGDEEAIFTYYGLTYQPGAAVKRKLDEMLQALPRADMPR
jgi:hypothetical protein